MNMIPEDSIGKFDTIYYRIWAAIEFNMRQYTDNISNLKRERLAMLKRVNRTASHMVDEVHVKTATSYDFTKGSKKFDYR